MALHKSAKKRIRHNAKNAVVNGARRSRIRTFIKNVVLAVKSGNYDAAFTAFRAAEPEIQRGANKGIFHPKTADRLISRLAARVRKIKAAA